MTFGHFRFYDFRSGPLLVTSRTVRAGDVTSGNVTSGRSTAWIHLKYDFVATYILLTCPDAKPTRFLHDYAEELPPIMTFIFQLSLDTGNIPDDWREVNMVALFKNGDRHQASNYRTVSLTSVSCKILEHVIHSQIMDYFDR